MRRWFVVLVLVVASFTAAQAQLSLLGINVLKPTGKLNLKLIPECSGLVQSLRYHGVFWALNDSDNEPLIIPVIASGKIAPGWSGPVRIEGVRNNDWEDIALDAKGNLIIADTGNNFGRRKQLMLHFVKEPKPGATSVRPWRTLRVHYEDQKEATPDYDCEAVFEVGGRIFFLTKRRSDTRTMLYRLDGKSVKSSNPLRLVDSFDIGGMVTAADTSPDGRHVAVLTYTAIWLFEYDAKSGSIFRKGALRLPIFAWQAEAIAFDGNDALVVGNEEGRLHRVPVSDLRPVKP